MKLNDTEQNLILVSPQFSFSSIFSPGLAALLLALGGHHLGPRLPGGLRLGRHGSLQLLGQPRVLTETLFHGQNQMQE